MNNVFISTRPGFLPLTDLTNTSSEQSGVKKPGNVCRRASPPDAWRLCLIYRPEPWALSPGPLPPSPETPPLPSGFHTPCGHAACPHDVIGTAWDHTWHSLHWTAGSEFNGWEKLRYHGEKWADVWAALTVKYCGVFLRNWRFCFFNTLRKESLLLFWPQKR